MISEAAPVRLTDVELSDATFRISTQGDVTSLAASLQEAGLINPPILLARPQGLSVVSGYRRIKAGLHNKWKQMPCRVLPESTPHDRCVHIAIAENVSQRTLNWVELARCFSLLSGIAAERDQMNRKAAALGLPDHPQLVEKIREIDSLSETVRSALADEVIALPVALELGQSSPEAAEAFERLFRQLRPGLNIQREILSLAKEISARDGIGVKELLVKAEKEGRGGRMHEDRSLGIQTLRRYLRKQRYPTIVETEKRFQKAVGSLPLGRRMELQPPKHFEGAHFVLRLQFSTVQELEDHCARLHRLVSSPELSRLVSR